MNVSECNENTNKTLADSYPFNAKLTLLQIETHAYELESNRKGYFLISKTNKSKEIPKNWLVPPEEEKHEQYSAIHPFSYDTQITAFPIGNGLIGLHLSSFLAMPSGASMAAASGKDVFLIYDPVSNIINPGLINLGVTKSRARGMGCFGAEGSHFLLADIDKDGMTDLGRVQEKINCMEHIIYQEGDSLKSLEQTYEQLPVKWHVFKTSAWEYDSEYDSLLNLQYIELPLINIVMLPIDFAGYITWRTYDTNLWPRNNANASEPVFLPKYRKGLIQEDRQKMKTY